MDTSKTYIKMMGNAWPIIKEDVEKTCITIFSRRLRMLYVLDGEVVMWRDGVNTSNHDRAFPLLEQDQLQKMVFPKDCTHGISFELLDSFMEWYQSLTYNFKVHIYSMEQLWLAFYMKEKHNKTWDGEKWIKTQPGK